MGNKIEMKHILCILSIILIGLIGLAGTFMSYPLHQLYIEAGEPLPALTEQVMKIFDMNNNRFMYCITPFILLHIGIMIFTKLKEEISDIFWYLFTSTWLTFFIYIMVICIALLLPQIVLMRIMRGEEPYDYISPSITVINLLIISSLTAYGIRIYKNKKTNTEPTLRTDGEDANDN